MKRFIILFIFPVFLISCNGNKSRLAENHIVLSVSKSLGKTLSDELFTNIKDYRVIPLETSDTVILGRCDIYAVTDDYIIIADNGTIFFFDIEGKLNHKFNRRGKGPGEYLSINDILVDDMNEFLYVHDYSKRMINQYTYAGESVNLFPNDSIASIGVTATGEFVASFSPSEQWACQVGVYDSNWKPINMFIEGDVTPEKVNLFIINSINEFNGDAFLYIQDTLFKITRNEVLPALVIDKGSLSLPKEIAVDFQRSKDREQYIWGDYGFWVGDYYFLYFNHKEKGYYDLWDLSSASLLCRNTHITFEEPAGIPFQIGEQVIYAWPVFAQGDKIYCHLGHDDAFKLHPSYDENDNPVILEITLN